MSYVLTCGCFVAFAIIDINSGLNVSLSTVDNLILLIFVFDYFIRLILSKDKISFIKSNILDLIAIIPLILLSYFPDCKAGKISSDIKNNKAGKILKVITSVCLFHTVYE
ncbi:MAG: ion transporter [Eisenbergiella sp.]